MSRFQSPYRATATLTAVLAFTLLASRPAGAVSPSKKKWALGIEAGWRTWWHYNRSTFDTTPPQTVLGEAQLTYWHEDLIGFYALYNRNVRDNYAQMWGGGVKFQAISLNLGFLNPFRAILIADYVRYYTTAAVPPQTWVTPTWLLRYGGGFTLGFSGTPLYISPQVMGSNPNGSFFLAPYLGVGLEL
jgi:hypothetical protein